MLYSNRVVTTPTNTCNANLSKNLFLFYFIFKNSFLCIFFEITLSKSFASYFPFQQSLCSAKLKCWLQHIIILNHEVFSQWPQCALWYRSRSMFHLCLSIFAWFSLSSKFTETNFRASGSSSNIDTNLIPGINPSFPADMVCIYHMLLGAEGNHFHHKTSSEHLHMFWMKRRRASIPFSSHSCVSLSPGLTQSHSRWQQLEPPWHQIQGPFVNLILAKGV